MTPELIVYLCKLNTARVKLASAVFLLFQIFNIIEGRLEESPLYIIGNIAVGASSLIFLISALLLRERSHLLPRLIRVFPLIFWVVMLLAMIPYFIIDIVLISQTGFPRPVNITLYIISFIVMPVFTRPYLLIGISAFFIVNISTAIIFAAPLTYLITIFLLSITGLTFAFIFQHQYLFTICRLQFEKKVDGLTGLLNRKAGMERIEATLEHCRRALEPVAVFMVDIDYFKLYNDTYGHIKGDHALKMVAKALKNTYIRSTDTICRFGGEEFLICMASCSEQEADIMANKLLKALESLRLKVPVNGISEYLTVSIGYVVYNPSPMNFDITASEIIDKADEAMYKAKKNGRNKIMQSESI